LAARFFSSLRCCAFWEATRRRSVSRSCACVMCGVLTRVSHFSRTAFGGGSAMMAARLLGSLRTSSSRYRKGFGICAAQAALIFCSVSGLIGTRQPFQWKGPKRSLAPRGRHDYQAKRALRLTTNMRECWLSGNAGRAPCEGLSASGMRHALAGSWSLRQGRSWFHSRTVAIA
jgi:hypothetical protein